MKMTTSDLNQITFRKTHQLHRQKTNQGHHHTYLDHKLESYTEDTLLPIENRGAASKPKETKDEDDENQN